MGSNLVMFLLILFMSESDEITVIDVWFWEFLILSIIGGIILMKSENDGKNNKNEK